MKKKIDLKKIKLPKKVIKKEDKNNNDVEENLIKNIVLLGTTLELKKTYEIIHLLFNSISNLNRYDIDLLERSKETNTYISEYKFDKKTKDKLRNDEEPIFFQLMRIDSKYFKNYLNYTIIEIVDDIIYLNKEFDSLKAFVLNELFNILNYRKTTITLLPKSDFYYLHNLFKEIKNNYVDNFILGNKKFYTSKDLKLDPYKNIIKDDVLYKVLYIVPDKQYSSSCKITKLNTRGIMAPVVLDKNGKPLNSKLWDCIYKINKNFNKEFSIRCLVPVNLRLKQNVLTMNNKILISYFNDLVMFRDNINKKISLLTFVNIDTYYKRKYL